jgi:hypothetical protein
MEFEDFSTESSSAAKYQQLPDLVDTQPILVICEYIIRIIQWLFYVDFVGLVGLQGRELAFFYVWVVEFFF